jgi:hypothetical protein
VSGVETTCTLTDWVDDVRFQRVAILAVKSRQEQRNSHRSDREDPMRVPPCLHATRQLLL